MRVQELEGGEVKEIEHGDLLFATAKGRQFGNQQYRKS